MLNLPKEVSIPVPLSFRRNGENGADNDVLLV